MPSRPLKGASLPWLLEGKLWLKRPWSTCLKMRPQRKWPAPSSHSMHLEKTPSSTLNPLRSLIRKRISNWRWAWILPSQSNHCMCMDPWIPSECQVCSQFLLHVSMHQRNWLIKRQSMSLLLMFCSHQSSSPSLQKMSALTFSQRRTRSMQKQPYATGETWYRHLFLVYITSKSWGNRQGCQINQKK